MLFSVLFACVVALPILLAQASQEMEFGTLRLGTWNIEWLGNAEKRRSGVQKAEDIATYVQESGVDLLALQEISQTSEGFDNRTNSILSEACGLLEKESKSAWKHILFPKENRAEKDQLVGVLWNTAKVTPQGNPFRIPVHRTLRNQDFWARHPYAIKFTTGKNRTDLVVIPIHMKSNRGGVDVTSKQRAEEAKALIRMLGLVENTFADEDVVVLGDTNCLKRDELAPMRFVANGFRDLNSMDLATWIKSDIFDYAPFDRIFVPDDQPEFAKSVQVVQKSKKFADEQEFRKALSDHWMVTTEVRIMKDDD